MSHTPALPTGYPTLLACVYQPVPGTCVMQLAHFSVTVPGPSVSLATVSLVDLVGGARAQERHFTRPSVYHPPCIPNCFGNTVFHLSQQCLLTLALCLV